jgi:parallel beta-helix repeat protein
MDKLLNCALYNDIQMRKNVVSGTMLVLVLTSLLTFAFQIPRVKAGGIIYIRPDGTVDPPTSSIQRVRKIYVFTDDIYNKSIEVQRNNVTLDGKGYMLRTSKEYKSLFGVRLSGRKNVTITNIVISDGFIHGIWLHSSSNNKIINNTITEVDIGIRLSSWSDHNFLANNTVIHTHEAILLKDSSYNTLLNNRVIDNFKGIDLFGGTQNTLRSNVMINNKRSFFVGFAWFECYIHDIDASNTIDGKPIYYWINRCNKTVPLDAACVVIVDSSRITVKNLIFKKRCIWGLSCLH